MSKNFDEVLAWEQDLYARKMWALWSISPSETTPHFIYSSGAVLTGRADLYIAGCSGPNMQNILNDIIERMPTPVTDEYLQQIHTLDDAMINGEPMRYRFTPMTADQARALEMYATLHAMLPYQPNICQLDLGDHQNRLPGEHGYKEWRKLPRLS